MGLNRRLGTWRASKVGCLPSSPHSRRRPRTTDHDLPTRPPAAAYVLPSSARRERATPDPTDAPTCSGYLETLRSVSSRWKILIVDEHTHAMITSVLSTYDILEEGIQREWCPPEHTLATSLPRGPGADRRLACAQRWMSSPPRGLPSRAWTPSTSSCPRPRTSNSCFEITVQHPRRGVRPRRRTHQQ